ncbi:MAG: hypothetical protein K8S23_13295 [Candidatus Cloacimonetes bacterium]|nr:hypothetical protein [Candidatus Cloacimonadota bacterium]
MLEFLNKKIKIESHCYGFIGSKKNPIELAKLFVDNNIPAIANKFSIRLENFEYFKLEYIEEKQEYEINFDADSSDELIKSIQKIKPVLENIVDWFDFEIYNDEKLVFHLKKGC